MPNRNPAEMTAILTVVNNDPPGLRCNRNILAAAEVANRYRVTVRLVPRSLAGPKALAPAVYLNDEPITVDGDERKGVADQELLAATLERAGISRQEKPGRLTEIAPAMERLREAIGEVPK